jgi:hypothetical protein
VLSACCAMCSRAAARVKLNSSATTRNERRCRNSTFTRTHCRSHKKEVFLFSASTQYHRGMNIRQTTGLTLLLACVTPIHAQIVESDGWASIRNLRRGDRIGVISTDRKRLDGRFESATDSAIAVTRAGGEQGARGDAVTIPQASVIRVYKVGTSRRQRMLIGVAAGLGAGAAVAVTLSDA